MPSTRHWMRSGVGSLMRCHPRRPTRIGKQHEERERRSRLREDERDRSGAGPLRQRSLPVKTARPSAAETPQRNAADAMKKYPRSGCGFGLEFAEFRIRSPNPMMGPNRATGQGARDQSRPRPPALHQSESRASEFHSCRALRSSRGGPRSPLMSRSSNAISLASRKTFSSSQERQPG